MLRSIHTVIFIVLALLIYCCNFLLRISAVELYVNLHNGCVLVTSRLDYDTAILYGITDRQMHRLEKVQPSAARVVLRVMRRDQQNMIASLHSLHWLPVKWRIEYKILVFRALHDPTPAYLAYLRPRATDCTTSQP